jgi:hypothetical protein
MESSFQHTTFAHIERPNWKSWKVRISSDDFRVTFSEYLDWSPVIIEVLHFKIAFQWLIHSFHDFFFGVPRHFQWYLWLPSRFASAVCVVSMPIHIRSLTLNHRFDHINIQYLTVEKFAFRWSSFSLSLIFPLSFSNQNKQNTNLNWTTFISIDFLSKMVQSKMRCWNYLKFPNLKSSAFGFLTQLQLWTLIPSIIVGNFCWFHLNQIHDW